MADRKRAARLTAARRGELGMTQQQLADTAGVDVKTIGSLERRGRWPIARSRARIEAALRWPPGELERLAEDSDDQLVAKDEWERRVLADPALRPDEKRDIIRSARRVRAELYPEPSPPSEPRGREDPEAAAG